VHRFDRDPGTCSIATHDGHLDFTLMVVQITWGAKVACRRAEVRALRTYFLKVQDDDSLDRPKCSGSRRRLKSLTLAPGRP